MKSFETFENSKFQINLFRQMYAENLAIDNS